MPVQSEEAENNIVMELAGMGRLGRNMRVPRRVEPTRGSGSTSLELKRGRFARQGTAKFGGWGGMRDGRFKALRRRQAVNRRQALAVHPPSL